MTLVKRESLTSVLSIQTLPFSLYSQPIVVALGYGYEIVGLLRLLRYLRES
jgi:hypothetical protein